MHKILFSPDPSAASAGADPVPVPPTTVELKKLLDAAAAGSTAAQKKLDELAVENVALRDRIDKLEAARKKDDAPPPAAPAAPAPAKGILDRLNPLNW